MERVFKVIDQDSKGSISLAEFLEAASRLSSAGDTEKVVFLFKIYDVEGDGLLSEDGLVHVMSMCLRESGIALPHSDVRDLTMALIDEARGGDDDEYSDEEEACISVDQLKRAFDGHPELLENLTFL